MYCVDNLYNNYHVTFDKYTNVYVQEYSFKTSFNQKQPFACMQVISKNSTGSVFVTMRPNECNSTQTSTSLSDDDAEGQTLEMKTKCEYKKLTF
ncbi:hypothetical protein DPMN_116519 [Dreissena polymorpha]|uniref:Uncharacterized protein n=1 Tax=Dreissena polymorpha TaxID=45954 RepID=A0A9D4QU10_DREPO|nr:hypothetical protein DPMN_116519 [Dreissena polymorpha]